MTTEVSDRRTHPARVVAWALWDWAAAAQHSVITTFVFGPYIVSGVVGDARPAGLTGNTWMGIGNAVAGVCIALIAPIAGQRADAGGRRRASLAVWSGLVFAAMLALFVVQDDPSYLWIGLTLMAAGTVFAEFATVSYNAMLPQIATRATIGRISGFGWSMGYFGGIFLLLICYVCFISPSTGWFGAVDADGLRYRLVAVFAAVWFGVFALPVLFAVPELPVTDPARRRLGMIGSYKRLISDIAALFRSDRHAVYFLLASALFRDGLAAVFTFGAILAVAVYGMDASAVLIFGVAANVVAAIGAVLMGRVEDRIGPKRVIMISLTGLITMATILLIVALVNPGDITLLFWVFALIMVLWVGPAQASSRSFLAQLSRTERAGQMFGLYATTGRAASFLAPALYAAFSGLFGDRIGVIGIIIVLLGGAVALAPVRQPGKIAGLDGRNESSSER